MLTPAQTTWIDRARDADIVAVAQRSPVNAQLKKQSREWIGPCPACGGTDRFAINPNKKGGVFNCRGSIGGDVIAMVRHVVGCEFLAACEIINGEPMPQSDRQVSKAEIEAAAAERERERARRDAEREAEQERYRENTRRSAYEIWRAGLPYETTPVEAYLKLRGIRTLPPKLPLRYAPSLAYFDGSEINEIGRRVPKVVHRGPAMLAPIVDAAGTFRGVHRTYLDLDQPKGKARITGADGEPADVKKGLGSKQGNVIKLIAPENAQLLYIGEGIETVLSVWLALHLAGRDVAQAAFYVASDLGNLAGKCVATVRHPTEKTEKGRPRMVEGPEPDLTDPGITIPDSVSDLVILGDGDSERFKTHCALHRASKRFAREGRLVRVAWADDGMDFNDVLMAA